MMLSSAILSPKLTLLNPRVTRIIWHSRMTFSKAAAFSVDIDYYAKLGVKKNASQADIKKCYYKLAKKYHPDSVKSTPKDVEKFKQITAAYNVLSNEDTKRDYDSARSSNFGHQTTDYNSGGSQFYGNREQTYKYNTGSNKTQ